MMWAYFEGQLINLSEFERFYEKDRKIYGITKGGREVLFGKHDDKEMAKWGIEHLWSIARKENGSD